MNSYVEEQTDYGCVTGKDARLYEICSDEQGKRLWINADDGSAVARFNTSTGVDVNNTATDQMAGLPECLWRTHGKQDYQAWISFVREIKSHFGLQLSVDAIDVGLLN